MQNNQFREKVQKVGDKALNVIDEYFDGKRDSAEKVSEAMKMVQSSIKIEHMNQIKGHLDRSLALRLIKFLPEDNETRNEYIRITNPEIQHLLLAKPKVTNKRS